MSCVRGVLKGLVERWNNVSGVIVSGGKRTTDKLSRIREVGKGIGCCDAVMLLGPRVPSTLM